MPYGDVTDPGIDVSASGSTRTGDVHATVGAGGTVAAERGPRLAVGGAVGAIVGGADVMVAGGVTGAAVGALSHPTAARSAASPQARAAVRIRSSSVGFI
jgi:hypothetical protein